MARAAIVLALTFGPGAAVARAQTPAGATPPDSAGYFSRAQFGKFLRELPSLDTAVGLVPRWTPLGARSSATAQFEADLGRQVDLQTAEARRQRLMRRLGVRSVAVDSTLPLASRGLFGLSRNAADVVFDGSLQMQLGTTRQRNLACTAAQVQSPSSGCSGGFAAPRLDNQVVLHSSGVFDQRFHLNIDFDSKADYAASNVINAYYLGLEDEKLQRVDIGTVRFVPPPSRFIAASIPSNNFGISATAVFGPVTLQGILATQKGSVVQNKTYTIGSSTVQPQDKLVRDLDYESGRLFWVVDPRLLAGYPAVDILNAGNIVVPADRQPSEVQIYRYVAANQSSGANANYDGITAVGLNPPEVAKVRWRLLKRNVDYWMDPSNLWFVLKARIDPSDYLAVSYRTRAGNMVGTLPLVDSPVALHDTLQLIYLPNRNSSSPLFPYSMRQAYRVAGTSLVRSSLRGTILVANSERPETAPGTFLSVLGLAVPANQGVLDVDNRLFPRLRDPGATAVIQDALLIFPSAQPFSNPELTPAERNDSLYATTEQLLFTQGPPSKFQLRLQFDAQSGADRNSITLDALQITPLSEHIELNGRPLTRNTDYTVDYATGRVSFLDANSLFGNTIATVTASFEMKDGFAQAPTSIAGLTGTWVLGARKTISFAGLYQAEATGYSRPPVGSEPRASLLAGITGDFTWNTPTLTAWANRLVTKRSTAPSSFQLSAEFALSHPDPNRSGDAYLEEFENDQSIRISAGQNQWIPGSVPKSAAGLTGILPGGFDTAQAVQLVAQNLIPNARDSIVQLSPRDIDTTIVLTKSTTPPIEPVLWLTMHADTAGGIVDTLSRSHWTQAARPDQPRWRTTTFGLSPTGTDLSRNAYFQFSLYETSDSLIEKSQMRIVLDLGKVSEDALSVAPTTFHVLVAGDAIPHGFAVGDTIYTGRQYVGVGRLDTEKTSFGAWNAQVNDIGILGDRPDSLIGPNGRILRSPALCQDVISSTILFVPWGDLGARCSNHNGAIDSEDLDGDNILDAQGSNDDVFRYVINLGADAAKYILRSHVVADTAGHPIVDRFGRSARWTTYRIPLRDADDTIGSPDIRLIRQLRLAFVIPATPGPEPVVRFGMALMQFTGAAWVGRAEKPIASLSGPTAQPHGSVLIGSVSTQDAVGLGYSSPPGIGNASTTVASASNQASVQINEKSLRIQATDLHAGERAEAYTRFAEGSRNLLAYRQLRVWVRSTPVPGLGDGWEDGRLRAYIKVGTDPYNFYLYRAPARTTTWDPELVIDVQVWKDLRQQLEDQRLHLLKPDAQAALACGGDTTAYVACNSAGYMVQVRDPQISPPNLAAVQELAGGLYYPGTTGLPIARTELWIDDIRVAQPLSTTGVAGALAARLVISDLATFDLSSVYQDGNFHQMGQTPTYQNVASVVSTNSVHLEKFLPARLGLVIPVIVTSNWGWVTPQLLSGTDVEAAGLSGLRLPRNDATAWAVSILDPQRAGAAPLSRWFLHPWSLNANGSTATSVTSLSEVSASNWSTSLGYFLNVQRRARPLGLRRLGGGLPRWLRESAAGQGIVGASFAPWPTAIQFASTLSHSMGELQAYQKPIEVLADTILKPVTSEQFLWRNNAQVTWQPFTMLTVGSSWSSTRDLRQYSDTTTLGRVVDAAHRSLFGTDLGVERDRGFTNNVTLQPRFLSWLGTTMAVGTNFILSRSLTTRNPVRIDGDTAGAYILPQTLDNSRYIDYNLSVDPHRLVQKLLGDSSRVTRAFVQVRPIEFTRRHTLESTFDLATFNPGIGYQLALGSFDSFKQRDGQFAINAADATTTAMSVTLDFPGGFTGEVHYSSTNLDQYQRNGAGFQQTSGTTESWPAGRFSWTRTFVNGPFLRVTAASGVNRDLTSASTPFGDGTTSTSTSEQLRVNPTLSLTLRNNVQVELRGDFSNNDGTNSGNLTKTQTSNVSEYLSWNFRMPQFISATRRMLTATVTVTETGNLSCIQRTTDASCIPYADLKRFEVNTGFQAFLQHNIRTGLTLSYALNSSPAQGIKTSTITLNTTFSIPLSSLGM